jgi:hypothetical protein
MTASNLARVASRQITRPLSVLAPLANQAIELGHTASELHYKKAGELLAEARAQLAPPAFAKWIGSNFKNAFGDPLTVSTAKDWMRYAAAVPAEGEKPYISLSDFKRRHLGATVISGHKRVRLPPDVKATVQQVDVGVLRQAVVSQAKERDMQHKLSLQLIDIGYKILATKLHPDKGGSQEAMSRLNQVRDGLKRHA